MFKRILAIFSMLVLILSSFYGCTSIRTKRDEIGKTKTTISQKTEQISKHSNKNKGSNKPALDVVFERIYQATDKYEIDVLLPKVTGSEVKKEVCEKINFILKRYVEQEIEGIKAIANEQKNELDFYPYTLHLKCEWDKSVSPYISFLFEEDSYTGGAHDLIRVKTFNFDLETGREVKLNDVLSTEQLNWIGNYILFARALCKDLDDPPYEVFWGQEKQVTYDEYILNSSIFKNGGILVCYEPYVIGSFARGIVRFWFSFDELNRKEIEKSVDLKDLDTIEEWLDANLNKVRKEYGLPVKVYSYEGGLLYYTKSGLIFSFSFNSIDSLESINNAQVFSIMGSDTVKFFGIPLEISVSELVRKLKSISEIKKIDEGISEESGCYTVTCELDGNIKAYIESKGADKSSNVGYILIKREPYGYGQTN
ncbi:PdaC/SigV domain-containing protein [Caldicellulosiruptor morganii]|uniref:DUF4163 domain-containing protein n=1 Tax=Caldicellulosiruptor morganii TaxID=1387555 RepID=A0ABY7BNE9_9FIRM|nr:DUF4163 domain-containing protein [Caldicellulosiruptor morganii]WAM34368.1 DUF4163 domain-containing protein [Caldicellulosiruptor morganii]